MYSYSMLADPTNTHVGFYIILLLCGFVAWGAVTCIREMGVGVISTIFLVGSLSLIGLSGYVSFTNAGIKVPVNTPVTAKFIGFQPEEQRHSCTNGKQTSTCYTNKMYAVFEVPEGRIVLPASVGSAMPAYVTLYKN